MVQLRTVLSVVDNSGVKAVRRIQVMNTRRRPGYRKDYLVASVVKALPDCTLKKGDLVRGYLVNSRYGHRRGTGLHLRYASNAMVLVNKKGEPLGTRVRIPLPTDLRSSGRNKRRSLAPHVV